MPPDVVVSPVVVEDASGNSRDEVNRAMQADSQSGTGWQTSAQESANLADQGIVGDLEITDGKSEELIPVGLSTEALKISAQELHDAIEKQDVDAIHRILEPMTAADRDRVEVAYHNLFDPSGAPDTLRQDLQQKLNPTESARDIAILDRSATTTNDAGELDYQLSKLAEGNPDGVLGIREVLATLNPDQIKQLDIDLKANYPDKYPKGLQSALFENGSISDQEKQVLRILAKGISNSEDGTSGRSKEDNIQLADLAVSMNDMNLLGEALRGGYPAAVKAREQLQGDAEFREELSIAFGQDNAVARDFINQGYISLATIADANNHGFFEVNRKNIELALANATLEERRQYAHGREIALSGETPAANSTDAKDLQFYQLTHDALVDAIHRRTAAPSDAVNAILESEALCADPEARARFYALWCEDESDYFAHGGTPENKEKDQQALERMLDASRQLSASSLAAFSPEYAFTQLLGPEGKLTAYDMASFGFPDSLIQQRLSSESPENGEIDRNAIEELYASFGIESQQVASDITKWEDLLIRGGSLVSTLAEKHGDASQVLQCIEEMTPEDWFRLHSPDLRDAFLKDIDTALTTYGVDEQTRTKAAELLRQKGDAPDFWRSRKIKSNGTEPDYDSLSPSDKVLYDYEQNANPYKTLRDIEALLSADPVLRAELNNDALLHTDNYLGFADHGSSPNQLANRLAEIIYDTASTISDASTAAKLDYGLNGALPLLLASLLDSGKVDLDTKVELRFPPETLFPELAALTAEDREGYLERLGLTTEQRELFDICAATQGGAMQLEDQVRAFVLNDEAGALGYREPSEYFDFLDDLESLSPGDLQQRKSRYAEKYHSDFDNDFLQLVDVKEYDRYKRLLTPEHGDGRQEYFDALGKLQSAETGYIPQGPDLNAQRATQLYAVALGDAQSGFASLSQSDQEQFQKYFGEALEQLKDAQREFAEKLIALGEKAVMFGAGLLAIAMSGGTLSPAVMAAIITAGGAIDGATRVAILKTIQGENFDGSMANVVREFMAGFEQGAIDTASMVTLPGAVRGAAELTTSIVDQISLGLGGLPDISLQNLNALRSSLSRLVSMRGTSGLTPQDIANLLIVDARIPPEQAAAAAQVIALRIKTEGELYEARVIVHRMATVSAPVPG